MGMKKVKMLKRLLLVTILFALMLAPLNASAASQKTKAMKAYKSYMAKKGSSARFAVAYLDKDSVPELIYYVPSKPLYTVFTWKSGKMKTMFSADYSKDVSNLYDFTHYYKKKGVLLAVPYSGAAGISGKNYFAYSGGKYKCVLSRNNSFGKISYYKVSGTKTLKYTKISASQFNKSLKKLVGNTKASKLAYYKNTAANRTKRLK